MVLVLIEVSIEKLAQFITLVELTRTSDLKKKVHKLLIEPKQRGHKVPQRDQCKGTTRSKLPALCTL